MSSPPTRTASPRLRGLAAAGASVALLTVVLAAVESAHHVANLSMLYLLVVIAIAVRHGRGAAVAAAVLAFLACDWFFVAPRFRFTVSDPAEWVALLVFLVTATVVGQLTALLRARADEARQREREAAALAEASWSVASQFERDAALAVVLQRACELSGAVGAAVVAWDAAGPTVVAHTGAQAGLADWLPRRPDEAVPAGAGLLVVALGAEEHVGALVLRMPAGRPLEAAARRAVDSLAHHAGVVLQRDRLMQVEARTRALHEADRLKTALLSMVSHDFRSPLASIKASAGSLLPGSQPLDPATQTELVQGITASVDRLNRMVENVLALSRLEAGAWRPQIEPTPVDEVVGLALEPFGPADNSRVRVDLEPGLGEVWVDTVQVAEVLTNLVANALRYSSPRTSVELRARRGHGCDVFEVADRGLGLPPGPVDQVFAPFWRGPGLGESARPGVGLGLAVCRGLVEAHGGTISARRRQGGGTVMRVELPRSRRDEGLGGG